MKNDTVHNIEIERHALQCRIDKSKTQLQRNKLGQFSTPNVLAKEILEFGLGLLNDREVSFLDPAIGTGVFYSALLEKMDDRQIKRAVGFEIDPSYAEVARNLWYQYGLDVNLQDFTQVKPEKNFNFLICNPPYVRHHHLTNVEKERLQTLSLKRSGIKLSSLAGLYCYFLLAAQQWLEDGAVAGWLIPSEFMTVNYGSAIQKYLLEKVTLLHIHRFDPKDIQFADALVSSVVLWIKNTPPPKEHRVKFTLGGSLTNPRTIKFIDSTVLYDEKKWTRFPVSEQRKETQSLVLGEFFKITRGVATGCNDFFILHEDEIKERGLPLTAFRPILPSSRYLTGNVIEAKNDGTPDITERLWLLNTSLELENIMELYPSLWEYLQMGMAQELQNRYLNKTRKPWYSQEKRPPAPLICTYMGRLRPDKKHPFRFLLNKSIATVSNVYLAMYPTPRLQSYLTKKPDLIEVFWNALNNMTIEQILSEGRVYGGGLYKLEPKELSNISIDHLGLQLDFLNETKPKPKQLQMNFAAE